MDANSRTLNSRLAGFREALIASTSDFLGIPGFHERHRRAAPLVAFLLILVIGDFIALFFVPLLSFPPHSKAVAFTPFPKTNEEMAQSVGVICSILLYGLVSWHTGRALYRLLLMPKEAAGARRIVRPGQVLPLLSGFYLATVVFFALFYCVISQVDPSGAFNPSRALNIWEGLYFSFITASTVGFGDFAPVSFLARFVTVFEIVVSVACAVFFFSIVASAIREATEQPAAALTEETVAQIVRTELAKALSPGNSGRKLAGQADNDGADSQRTQN